MALDIIVVFVIFGWAMLFFSLWSENVWIGFMSGAFVLVIGIFALINGVGIWNDWLTQTFGYVHIGVGLIFSLVAGYEAIDSW